MLLKTNKRVLLFIIIGYVIFSSVVIGCFFLVRENPIDKAAITYIWNCDDFEEYNDIFTVSKYLLKENKKTDDSATVWYAVDTKKEELIVQVKLNKIADEWIVESLEIVEVGESQFQ